MIQQDFGRRLVLPALEQAAVALFSDDPTSKGRTQAHRAGLCKAADDGFYTLDVANAHGVCDFWFSWCRANRHPPLVRTTSGEHASLDCDLSRLAGPEGAPVVCYLPSGARAEVDRLLRSFIGRRLCLYGAGAVLISVQGVPLDDSRECASLLLDLLGETLAWEA